MSDRTSLHVLVHQCPDNERETVAGILRGVSSSWAHGPEFGVRYIVADTATNTDGKPIRAGQQPLRVGPIFAGEQDAHNWIVATYDAADVTDGRYDVDEIPDITTGEWYVEYDVSCGTADEIAEQLLAGAPGTSFWLHDEPELDWLGSLWMHTRELGTFTASCNADGAPVFTRDQIKGWITEPRPGTGPYYLANHLDNKTGGPWFEAFAPETEVTP